MLSNLLALPLSSFILAPDSLAMLSPFLAFDFNPQSIPVVAIIGGLSLAAIIIVSGLFFQHRKRLMWHETARIALEKGQPLPPVPPTDEELDSRPPVGVSFAEWQQAKRAESRRHDIKGGLVLIAVGVGLYVMLPEHDGTVGAIPGLIGVALLLNAVFEKLFSRSNSDSAGRPPQS